MSRDYYDVLEIPDDSDQAAIKRAWRRLIQKWHPDKNNDSAESYKRYDEITKAYQTLKDPGLRAAYDRLRASTRPGTGSTSAATGTGLAGSGSGGGGRSGSSSGPTGSGLAGSSGLASGGPSGGGPGSGGSGSGGPSGGGPGSGGSGSGGPAGSGPGSGGGTGPAKKSVDKKISDAIRYIYQGLILSTRRIVSAIGGKDDGQQAIDDVLKGLNKDSAAAQAAAKKALDDLEFATLRLEAAKRARTVAVAAGDAAGIATADAEIIKWTDAIGAPNTDGLLATYNTFNDLANKRFELTERQGKLSSYERFRLELRKIFDKGHWLWIKFFFIWAPDKLIDSIHKIGRGLLKKGYMKYDETTKKPKYLKPGEAIFDGLEDFKTAIDFYTSAALRLTIGFFTNAANTLPQYALRTAVAVPVCFAVYSNPLFVLGGAFCATMLFRTGKKIFTSENFPNEKETPIPPIFKRSISSAALLVGGGLFLVPAMYGDYGPVGHLYTKAAKRIVTKLTNDTPAPKQENILKPTSPSQQVAFDQAKNEVAGMSSIDAGNQFNTKLDLLERTGANPVEFANNLDVIRLLFKDRQNLLKKNTTSNDKSDPQNVLNAIKNGGSLAGIKLSDLFLNSRAKDEDLHIAVLERLFDQQIGILQTAREKSSVNMAVTNILELLKDRDRLIKPAQSNTPESISLLSTAENNSSSFFGLAKGKFGQQTISTTVIRSAIFKVASKASNGAIRPNGLPDAFTTPTYRNE